MNDLCDSGDYNGAQELAECIKNYNDRENDYDKVCGDTGTFDGRDCSGAGTKKSKSKELRLEQLQVRMR